MASKGGSAAASGGANSQTLPTKEATMFRSVIKLYETKQFKKALKTADQILKKYPNHGETLAMKGLTLSSIPERKSEAHEFVRAGLKADMKSHVCWHVYGLLYRAEREYREASKAYLQALRIDKDNLQILRDLALLQMQSRDYEGFENTRRRILNLKPNQKINWVAFALSYHLLGNFSSAIQVLETYEGTLKEGTQTEEEDPYEVSELLMYKNMLYVEAGDYGKSLAHLISNKDKVVDKLAWKESKAEALLKLGRLEEADADYRELININDENLGYFWKLVDVLVNKKLGQDQSNGPIGDKQREALKYDTARELQSDLASQYSSATSIGRLALDLYEGDRFRSELDKFVRKFLYRGIPSLFSVMKPLYTEPAKVEIIEKLFESYLQAVKDHGDLPASIDPSANMNGKQYKKDNAEDTRLMLLTWIGFYLVQHYDRVGKFTQALSLVDESITISPSCVELYLAKGKVLKHVGDRKAAVEVMDHARKMDTADRYLNHKCAKYAMQADQVKQAEQLISLFTRDGDIPPIQALYEMQCLWYELEAGESFFRTKQYSRSLKRLIAVDRHFADFIEDQFDFHVYCLRKMTLRSYVRTLRMEDHVKDSRYFVRGAKALVRLFLRLADQPLEEQLKNKLSVEDAELQHLSAAERKKALAKKRKAEAKGEQDKAEGGKKSEKDASSSTATSNSKSEEESKKEKGNRPARTEGWMEVDPDGTELLRGYDNYLEEAAKYARELEKWAPNDPESHRLAFEVAIRKRKYLLMLRALNRGLALNRDDEHVFIMLVRMLDVLDHDESLRELPANIKEILMSFRESLRTQATGSSASYTCAIDYALSVAANPACTPRRQFSVAEAVLLICRASGTSDGGNESKSDKNLLESRSKAFKLLTVWSADKFDISLKSCEYILSQSIELGLSDDEVKQFKACCLAKFPRADYFKA
eukprot:CAMPEP_0184699820 /NCGR_PEP_ID=MMETSP0313-20130426/5936_1 /TAXON_ID=2792 /ORGANISM="Porphyridium aerugineum, Strain SAG 1380-2" /LENGTH=933 /DNA_ID=CAMNT_0027158949 /DNA_START=48 /DNA_END=2849 /DNA_ORIENTATION=-